MAKLLVQATYVIEVRDELALRDAAFKARMKNPAFAVSYSEENDSLEGALSILFGDLAPHSVPGVHLWESSVASGPITETPSET